MTLLRGVQTAALTLALSFFIAAPAMAQAPVPTLDNLHNQGVTMPDSSEVYPESAYTLTEIENADPENLPQNAITLYDKTEVIKYYDPQTGQEVAADDRQEGVEYKEVTTIQTTPKYYTVELKQTEYGSGDKSMTFGWEKNADGNYELKQNPTNPVGQTITYKYTETGFSETETHQKDLGTIENPSGTSSNHTIFEGGAALNNPTGKTDSLDNVLFKDNSTTGKVISTTSDSKYADVLGGAVYNEGTISSVTGAFINNSLDITTEETSGYLSVDAKGGAIANSGTIENITADFVGNYVSTSGTGIYKDAYGGAIDNYYGTIGDITGDFIGNYASTTDSSGYGGAIANSGTIENITADFIGNSAVRGGAIYNYNGGTIVDITGDFIGNYASVGTISNYFGGTIGDITGDFINNRGSLYGAIVNFGSDNNQQAIIDDITGNFIGNYVYTDSYASGGAIYNRSDTPFDKTNVIIANITGNFIGNYTSSTGDHTDAGAIYNDSKIGDITGNFIGNYTSSSADFAKGGAIYNFNAEIGNIRLYRQLCVVKR